MHEARSQRASGAAVYAAGARASNLARGGNGCSSGTCLGEAISLGRRVGRQAAARVA